MLIEGAYLDFDYFILRLLSEIILTLLTFIRDRRLQFS